MFQKVTQIVKTSYSFNDFEWRRTMVLSCRQKTIEVELKRRGIQEKLNLFFELPSFFRTRKRT